ncbi:MAG: elongation factor Ts [Candidatus Omnitrophica bacterium]|nr:elongation factor Ts [Candidatus Omnitrophota bacterium]
MRTKGNLEAIKALREKTSASLNDVRAALESAGGDEAKALAFLRQRGAAIAEKRHGRSAGQGRVEAYVHHNGRLGSLVEVNCETDFVARTPEFLQFCRDVAMQVAAMNPRYLRAEDVPPNGPLSAEEVKDACLLEQPSVKDPGVSVKDLLKALIAKTGENVVIRRFVRFTLGET